MTKDSPIVQVTRKYFGSLARMHKNAITQVTLYEFKFRQTDISDFNLEYFRQPKINKKYHLNVVKYLQ